jgi:hypothetical protein
MSLVDTPMSTEKNLTKWSVAFPAKGAAVTLTLSLLPYGFPMASCFALRFPRTLRTNTSSSQAQKDLISIFLWSIAIKFVSFSLKHYLTELMLVLLTSNLKPTPK